MPLFIVTVICYFCGSIPFGLILAKMNGVDIRKHGSGNIGATNVLRTLGKKWGYTCFLLDFLKGFLPVFLVGKYFSQHFPELANTAVLIALPATIAGHVFSIFLKFKGGKGVATGAGAIMALCPQAVFCALVLWIICFKMSGYVSLASILAALAIPTFAFALNATEQVQLPSSQLILLTVVGILVTYMHKSNIKRLLNGTENSFKKR